MTASRFDLKPRHCIALLFIAVFAAYGNSLRNGLVGFDDVMVLNANVGWQGGPGAVREWLRASSDPLVGASRFVLQRQLRNLSLYADKLLFGADLWAAHLVNVLHHWLAACLVFLIASRLLGGGGGCGGGLAAAPSASGERPRAGYGGPLAAALIFALHPLQTEAVAYLAGRRDLLCAVLSLASFLAWLKSREEGSLGWLAAAMALWLLALGAKQSALTLPLLWGADLFLHRASPGVRGDAVLGRRPCSAPGEGGVRRGRGLAAFFACAALAAAAVLWLHLRQAAEQSFGLRFQPGLLWYGGSPLAQWATEPRILANALKLLAWPAALSGDYSYRVFEPSSSFLDRRTLLACAALAALAWGGWRLGKSRPLCAFALLWAALTYAPVLPVLPSWHNQEVFAEHWLYLPLFGVSLLAADAWQELRSRFAGTAPALLAAVLAAFLLRTAARNRDWRDEAAFWTATATGHPECARALAAQGLALMSRGELIRAEALHRRAVELRPDHPQILVNFALLHHVFGRRAQAQEALEKALHLSLGPLMLGPIRYNQGAIHLAAGRAREAYRAFKDAQDAGMGAQAQYGLIRAWILLDPPREVHGQIEEMYRHILMRNPDYAPALNDLGLRYLMEGRPREALPLLERASRVEPGFVNARINLGLALTELGDYAGALSALRESLRLDPSAAEAWIGLSALNRRWGFMPRALEAARRGVALSGSRRAYRELLEVKREMVYGRIRRRG